MEEELKKMLKSYATLIRAADLKSHLAHDHFPGKADDIRALLIRYAEESIRIIRVASPIGLAAVLGALANTALIYALIPYLHKVQKLDFWVKEIAPKSKMLTLEDALIECSFFELIKISQKASLLKTAGLRKRVLNQILSAHGFENISLDFVPSSDSEMVKNTLHTIKTFRNVLHPGKLLLTPDAKSGEFFEDVILQGVILIAFLTELLVSQDFTSTSTTVKT